MEKGSNISREKNLGERETEEIRPDSHTALSASGFGTEYGDYNEYKAEGKKYLVFDDGRIGVLSEGMEWRDELTFLDSNTEAGRTALEKARGLVERDQRIHEARRRYAKELAKGDMLLEKVLIEAVEMSDGREPKPEVIDGVNMYKVGGNASHDALMGVQNGRLYLFSRGEEIYLLPDNAQERKQISVEGIFDMVAEELYWEWVESLAEDDVRKLAKSLEIPLETEEDMWMWKCRGENAEKLKKYFREQYDQKIDNILRPRIEAYKKSGVISWEENAIEVKLEDDLVFVVYLKRMLSDVTDEESVYIGRGATFQIKSMGN